MSSRVLKKLHGEPELDLKEAEEILSDIESEKEKKQINNRYDLVMCYPSIVCTFFIAKFVFVLYWTIQWKEELGLQSNVLINYLFFI